MGVVGDALGQMRFFDQSLDERRVGANEVFLDEFGHEVVAAEVGVFP